MAIAQTLANIVIGTATTLTYGAVDMGPTSEDGITVNVGQEFFDHKNDQIKGIVKKTLVDRKVTVNLQLTESDMVNYHMSLNLEDASIAGTAVDIDDTQQDNKELVIVAPSAAGTARTFTFHECQIIGAVEHVISKSQAVVLNVEIEAMLSTTDSNQFATAVDA